MFWTLFKFRIERSRWENHNNSNSGGASELLNTLEKSIAEKSQLDLLNTLEERSASMH
jgi:hypothetical protein